MAKILFVKTNPNHKRIQIGVEDDDNAVSVLTVKESTYTSLNSPGRGDVISECELCDLRFDDEIYRASKKAISLIADVDRSRYELRMKLFSAGFSSEAVDVALTKCEEYGYLDEERQLERLVEREANRQLRGRYYIKRKLASKGYRTSLIDRVIDKLVDEGQIDFDSNLERLAEKRGVTDETKFMALKYRYGYEI